MSYILPTPYQFHEERKIWSRPDYQGIAYNDGDSIETRLLQVVNEARDLTVLSSELRQHCTDWPSLYHLSSSRANILRPFAKRLPDSRVLEIGAGCGAITRYLGESGSQVLALEGTWRRAEIARSRTRDLDNVTVLAETFEQFATDNRFDVVTLIGVLEYASMFVGGDSPDLTMLERARQLLAPGGLLIVAIENQLGLKYFAGALEDHVGKPSFGLEDRYRAGGVRTYGRHQLQDTLRKAGFAEQRFFAPFPDYKLPVTIISEEGIGHPQLDTGSLVAQSARRDHQLPPVLAFQPERVWPVLHANELALDLSNSFLVGARVDADDAPDYRDLAWHFSTERRGDFCKITYFTATDDDRVVVQAERAVSGGAAVVRVEDLYNVLDTHAPLHIGKLMSERLISVVVRDGWTDGELKDFFDAYFRALEPIIGLRLQAQNLTCQQVDGRFVDAIPQNLVQGHDGSIHLIDLEWRWSTPLTAQYLVFRALISLCAALTSFGRHKQRTFRTRIEFIRTALQILGSDFDDQTMGDMLRTEARLQRLVSGIDRGLDSDVERLESMLAEWPYAPPNVWQLAEDQERQLLSQDRLLSERLQMILDLQGVLAERDRWIGVASSSWSWKLTRPLRLTGRFARQPRATLAEVSARVRSAVASRWRALK